MKTNAAGLKLIKQWAEVRNEDECWPYKKRSFASNGTGRLKYGQLKYKGKKWRAHRFAASLCVNELPAGSYVCHTCDNPLCMNPTHLFIGSPADNVADKMNKGRHRASKGEKNGLATISDAQVEEVRSLARAGVTQRIIAAQYGISQSLVSMIKNNRTRSV